MNINILQNNDLIADFLPRNSYMSAYLNNDALKETGCCALDDIEESDTMGLKHALKIGGLDESLSNAILLYIYMYGLTCTGDMTYYLGIDKNYLSTVISRLLKRNALSEYSSTKKRSFISDKFYYPDYSSPILEKLATNGAIPFDSLGFMGNINSRTLAHSYGESLTAMLISLYCNIRRGYSVKRIMYEKSLSSLSRKRYVAKAVSDITTDIVADIILPCGSVRTLDIEFDTGSEHLDALADKFTDYSNTPIYTGGTDDGAFFFHTILFSYNSLSIKSGYHKSPAPFMTYLKIYARVCIINASRLGIIAEPGKEGLNRLYECDCSFCLDPDFAKDINLTFINAVNSSDQYDLRRWAASILSDLFPNLSSFIHSRPDSSMSLATIIDEILDSSAVIMRADITSFYELTDLCDAFMNNASDVFTIGCMRSSLCTLVPDTNEVNDSALLIPSKCADPSRLMHMAYNRMQYAESFKRHLGLASKIISRCESSIFSHHGAVLDYSPLYKGYEAYFAPTHLISNYLDAVIRRNSDGSCADPSLLYMQSYFVDKHNTSLRILSPDLYLNRILGSARLRDILVDDVNGRIYFVRDASIDTSSLITSAMLMRHYSPTLNENDGYHITIILLVRSFSEIKRISKSIFSYQIFFANDEKSCAVFALHPSLDFGFRSNKPRFFICNCNGIVSEFEIF